MKIEEVNKLEDEKMRIDLQNINTPKLAIRIEVILDDIIIAAKTSFDFEGAEENLGKLRRNYEMKQADMEAESEREKEEV